MSVYEFEYLKDEAAVLEYWKSSSIYIICQRPVLFFDDIWCENGTISMKIRQRGREEELKVSLTIDENDKSLGGADGFWVNFQFYDREKQTEQPYKNAAGIKLLNSEHEFVVWYTPERLIYEYVYRRLNVDIDGDIHDFLKYTVHYIGQAQNQGIWERLTGHEKLSSVLIKEHPFIEGEFSPFELSLIFLKLEDASEIFGWMPASDSQENISKLDEGDFDSAVVTDLDSIRHQIVNDYEAYLVNFFEPKYNKILFNNYPDIKSGLKSLGYSEINHRTEAIASLITEEASFQIEISPIFTDVRIPGTHQNGQK